MKFVKETSQVKVFWVVMLHGVITQETSNEVFTAMKTLNLTSRNISHHLFNS